MMLGLNILEWDGDHPKGAMPPELCKVKFDVTFCTKSFIFTEGKTALETSIKY